MHARGIRVIGRHRVLPRSGPRFGRLEERQAQPQVIQTPDGAAVLGLRRVHELRRPGRPEVQHRHRRGRGTRGHRRRALRLRAASRRPASRAWSSRDCAARRSTRSSSSSARRGWRSSRTARSSALSVFGVAATRPTEVAQDIPAMARSVDYVAPMVYPSHWGNGEYNVANPNSEPYEIVLRSLRDFRRQTRGTGARVVPWLQDFTLGVTYGPTRGAQPDQGRAARRHRRVHPLGSDGHVHVGGPRPGCQGDQARLGPATRGRADPRAHAQGDAEGRANGDDPAEGRCRPPSRTSSARCP